MKKIKKRTVKYPVKIHKLAKPLAEARHIASGDSHYGKGTKGYRENDLEVHEQGIVGELIGQYVFKDRDCSFAPLFSQVPCPEPDAVIDGETVDFKGKKPDDYSNIRIFINKDAHLNPNKKCDKYMCYLYDESTLSNGFCEATEFEIDYSLVTDWEQADWVQPCFYTDITDDNTEES
tara:strand:+ start:111 stop:641 length:531 start_codon:yes stop_codon:yes gene_type:complete